MAQRISRAKQTIKTSGVPFAMPTRAGARASGSSAVLHVLYLIFNEGYASSTGAELQRTRSRRREAIRLDARGARGCCPTTREVAGPARADAADRRAPRRAHGPDGELIPLDEQDRTLLGPRGDRRRHRADQRDAVARRRSAPYQLQAAIAAVHDEARARRGHRLAADPRALRPARAHVRQPDGHAQPRRRGRDGARPARRPRAARRRSTATRASRDHYRLDAVRAHLLEMAGDADAAVAHYLAAARRTASFPSATTCAQAARLAPTRR